MRYAKLFTLLTFLLFTLPIGVQAQDSVLPSWNDGPSKAAIIDFVRAVSDPASPDFVPEAKRVATFDNDGTLWSEHPIYTQLHFAIDRVKALAPQHPEWREKQPFKAVLEDDMDTLIKSGKKGLLEIVMATHAGMSAEEFSEIVNNWLRTAKNPVKKRLYTDLVYKPMLELLDYLRAHGFKTYIVSGGGIAFMRPWTAKVYGIPPEQVIGSSIAREFAIRDGKAVIIRQPKINFIDDNEGKPIGILEHIGQRPIFAFGNSDGDLQMLQYATLGGSGRRFAGIIKHTDAEREFAYTNDTHVGRLDKALGEAKKHNWTVVDMKREWRVVYR